MRAVTEARRQKVSEFEAKYPLTERVFSAYGHVGYLDMGEKLVDFATLHGLGDVSELVFIEKHNEWLHVLKEIMLDMARAVDFLARVANMDLKIASGALVVMGKGYASRTSGVWNINVRRRVLTPRPLKEIWWVSWESD